MGAALTLKSPLFESYHEKDIQFPTGCHFCRYLLVWLCQPVSLSVFNLVLT